MTIGLSAVPSANSCEPRPMTSALSLVPLMVTPGSIVSLAFLMVTVPDRVWSQVHRVSTSIVPLISLSHSSSPPAVGSVVAPASAVSPPPPSQARNIERVEQATRMLMRFIAGFLSGGSDASCTES